MALCRSDGEPLAGVARRDAYWLVSNKISALRDATRSTTISAGNASTGNARNGSLTPSSPTVLPRRPRRSDTRTVNMSSECCASCIESALRFATSGRR